MTKLVLKHPWLGSSVDATKVSLTIKGILIGIVAVAVPVAMSFGYDVSGFDFDGIIEQITTAVALTTSAVSAIMVVWGMIRKFINK